MGLPTRPISECVLVEDESLEIFSNLAETLCRVYTFVRQDFADQNTEFGVVVLRSGGGFGLKLKGTALDGVVEENIILNGQYVVLSAEFFDLRLIVANVQGQHGLANGTALLRVGNDRGFNFGWVKLTPNLEVEGRFLLVFRRAGVESSTSCHRSEQLRRWGQREPERNRSWTGRHQDTGSS